MNTASISQSKHVILSRMLRIMSMKRGEIYASVKGGVSLQYVKREMIQNGGKYSISISKAIELNSIIARLAKVSKNQLARLYEDFKMGKIKESELTNAMRDITQRNNKNLFTQNIIQTQGLVVNAQR